jgi:hypothetical protein
MQGVMERAQQAMEASFADESLSFEERIVAALDALMGQRAGRLARPARRAHHRAERG